MKPYTEFLIVSAAIAIFCMLVMQCILYWSELDLLPWRRVVLMVVIVFIMCLVMERVGYIIFWLTRK